MSNYDIFALFYDALTENVEYDKRSAYYQSLLDKYGVPEGILLDLACGTGSMAVRMSKLGYDVIGVDCSASMLSEAQCKAFEAEERVLFLCQKMQELDLYGTINAAICTLDSLNHLCSSQDLEETIRRVSLFTEPGGLFVFDVNTPFKHRNVLADNAFVFETDDVYCVWQNEPMDNDVVQITLDFFEKDGEQYYRSREQFCERAYDLDFLYRILKQNGFTVLDTFDDMTMNPLQSDSQRAVIVARKENIQEVMK